MVDINKPITNPELLQAIEDMKLSSSSENLDKVLNEVMRARFLSPVMITPAPQPGENGEIVLKEKTTISFHMIEDKISNSYFLAFTDWDELRKWNSTENMQTIVSTFDDYAAMVLGENGRGEGFVINPFGSNMPFTRSMIESLKEQKDELKAEGVTEHVIEKETKVRLGLPSVYPKAMVDAVTGYLGKQKSVEKAYLLLMIKEDTNESSYLLIVDLKGEKKEIFEGIAKAAKPYLNDMYLDLIPYDSDFGVNAAQKTKPFYKKKKFGFF